MVLIMSFSYVGALYGPVSSEKRYFPMSAAAFRSGYPAWRELEAQRDPGIMSDFWRRVTAEAA